MIFPVGIRDSKPLNPLSGVIREIIKTSYDRGLDTSAFVKAIRLGRFSLPLVVRILIPLNQMVQPL